MSLALVCVRRDGRFDPLAMEGKPSTSRRALGFTRCAGRKWQFELLTTRIVTHVPLVLSRCGHLPAPDYLPVYMPFGP
jgi:hypothetical protein